jgi:hypothetical protein
MFCNGGTNLWTGVIKFESTGKISATNTLTNDSLLAVTNGAVSGWSPRRLWLHQFIYLLRRVFQQRRGRDRG